MKRFPVHLIILATLAAGSAAQSLWGQVAELQPTDALAVVSAQLSQESRQLDERFTQFQREHPEVVARRSDDVALAAVKLEKVGLLLSRYQEEELRNQTARKILDEAKALLDLLVAGKEFPKDLPGFVEKAYLSPEDGSPQPYYLYIPEKLDPKKPVPLLLFLHGYIGYMDKLNWLDLTFPLELPKQAEEANAIVLAPFARSNTDFQGIGEADVVETIRRTLATTPADPDRVFLGGVSMGGSGVWTVASHHPDLFAGIFPVAGRTDYYLWKGLKPEALPRFQRWLIDKEFSISVPQNFLNLPSRTYHTRDDILVNVEHSRRMHRALLAVGSPAVFNELAEGNHWTWTQAFGDPKLAEWAKATRRQRFPETVRFKLYELHANRAYWVTIERIAKWGAPAEVTAKRVSPELIEVRTQNVGALTLHLDREGLKLAPAVTVDVDGKKSRVELEKTRDFTTLAPEAGPMKRKDLCGPVSDVFNGKFLLVFGSRGDPAAMRADQMMAVKMAQDWYTFSTGMPRVKPDTAVDDADLASSNLVLFGTPATNALLARMADKLPVRFADGKYVLGRREYPATLGLIMVYPNPLNPGRYVVIASGMHYGERLPVNHKYDLLPDYMIFENRFEPDGDNHFRCAGFFDSRWQLDESLMETQAPAPPPAEDAVEPAPAPDSAVPWPAPAAP